MNFVLFALAIPVHVLVCFLGVRAYVCVANYLGQQIQLYAARTVVLYSWFLIFVALEIPFAVFFQPG